MSRLDHAAMRQRVRLAEVWLAVIVVLGALLVGRQIITGSMFQRAYHVSVDLPDASGLHPHSDVTYRGQHIGTVTSVALTPAGVQARLAIDHGVKLPVDTQVVVADLSAVGEQYVDFRPRTAAGPFLADGAVLRPADAVLPLPTYQMLDDIQHLMTRIDVRDIRTISREVRAIFGHGDVNLPGLADEISRTLTMAEHLTPAVFQLLRTSHVPLQAMADLTPQIRSFVASARSITAQLRAANPVIARLIDQGAVLIPVIDTQFASTEPVLVQLLQDGTPTAVMASKHLQGLEHWYQFGPLQMTAMATATNHGAHVVLAFRVPSNCHYGADVSPYDKNAPLPLDARCTTVSPTLQQRGSQYVPHQ